MIVFARDVIPHHHLLVMPEGEWEVAAITFRHHGARVVLTISSALSFLLNADDLVQVELTSAPRPVAA